MRNRTLFFCLFSNIMLLMLALILFRNQIEATGLAAFATIGLGFTIRQLIVGRHSQSQEPLKRIELNGA